MDETPTLPAGAHDYRPWNDADLTDLSTMDPDLLAEAADDWRDGDTLPGILDAVMDDA